MTNDMPNAMNWAGLCVSHVVESYMMLGAIQDFSQLASHLTSLAYTSVILN